MIYVGIDLHASNMVIVAVNGKGEVAREEKISTDPEKLDQLFSTFDEPVKAVVECTSFWYWLADWCRQQEVPLTLAHSKMVKAISYAKVKTDTVDAKTLAELLRADLIPEAYQVNGKQRQLRELTRGRLRMVQRRNKLRRILWNQAAKYNVDITRKGWQYPDQLWEWLQPQLPEGSRLEAELTIEQVIQLTHHIQRLEEAIEQYSNFDEQVQRLLEIPGMGKVGVWSILAEIGDISRFPSPRQFVSYCRLVPGSKDSGGRRRHKSGSKDGNKYLRLAFQQAAVSAYSYYPVVKKYYRKIKLRSGKRIARVVVAKELAKITWHMLTKKQPYKGFKGQSTKIASDSCWPRPISPQA